MDRGEKLKSRISAGSLTIGIIYNPRRPPAMEEAVSAAGKLLKAGHRIVGPAELPPVDPTVEAVCEETFRTGVDMALVFGGDGTIISAIRRLHGWGVPLLGVNTGNIGFLAETNPDELGEALDRILAGDFLIDNRMMVDVTVEDNENCRTTVAGLNDAVINRDAMAKMVDIRLKVDGLFVDSFRGDGVIVATPTGSTGYSLSAGGPIVHPDIEMMLVTPICAHRLHSRSLVVSGDQTVTLEIGEGVSQACLVVDGQPLCIIKGGEIVKIAKSRHRAALITFPEKNFYRVLTSKLLGGPR